MRIRKKLKLARKLLGWSPEVMAERSGISAEKLKAYEGGDDSALSMGELLRIASALNDTLENCKRR